MVNLWQREKSADYGSFLSFLDFAFPGKTALKVIMLDA